MTKDNSEERLPTAVVVLLLLFIIGNIADVVSTILVLPGESNPIYVMTGTLWAIVAVKLLVIVGIAYAIKSRRFANETSYFILTTVLVFITLLLFFAAGRNFYHGLNTEESYVSPSTGEPITYVEYVGETTTPEQRAIDYSYLAVLLYAIPIVILIVSFEIYNRTKQHFKFEKIQQNGILVQKEKSRWRK